MRWQEILDENENAQVQEVEQISKDEKFWGMVNRLDRGLPELAQDAISAWVGGDPEFKENGGEFGIMISKTLERAFELVPPKQSHQVRVELYEAMVPIKHYLRSKYGDQIEIHRGYGKEMQKRDDTSIQVSSVANRRLLSYTSNKRIAMSFAGVGPMFRKILTDDQIDKLVNIYATKGKVSFFGKTYTFKEEEYPEMKMGKSTHEYDMWYVDDGKEKIPTGGVMTGIWRVLSDADAMDIDGSKSKINDDGGYIVTKDGRKFIITREKITQEIDDRIPTGKMFKVATAVVTSNNDDEDDENGDIDAIDGKPEDVRREIESINDFRKNHNAEQQRWASRVRTDLIDVENIVWVTDRFNQQEFIVYVGNDESKLNPKFD